MTTSPWWHWLVLIGASVLVNGAWTILTRPRFVSRIKGVKPPRWDKKKCEFRSNWPGA